jgi:hypothetical protein
MIAKSIQDAQRLYNPKVLYDVSDEYDTLLQNGMGFNRGESNIVAIESDTAKRNKKLQSLREKNPLQEYRVQGDYIDAICYYPMHGSNADVLRDDKRDYEWSGEQMGVLTMPFDGRK